VTLNDLAEKLNISTSTISRALNHPELVAEVTRNRILAAVEVYGYEPNAIARSLRSGETRMVGLVVSDLQNPFYSTVAKAIQHKATQHGYSCVVCDADENANDEVKALRLLSEMKVSGLIHASTGGSVDMLRRLRDEGVAIVDIDRASNLGGIDTVLVDNEMGGRMAAEYLLQLGHRRIAMISGPLHLTTGQDRLVGFQSAMKEAGIYLADGYIEIGDFKEQSGYLATQHLLSLREPPTAIFVGNNEMMAGCLDAIRERGISVPRELSILSFDDVRWAKYVDPALTVIAQPTEQLGVIAAELLFDKLGGRRKPERHVLEPSLIPRSSCAPPFQSNRKEVVAAD
jgi:DNA-binding LacI/PurR family transcriptional regulator